VDGARTLLARRGLFESLAAAPVLFAQCSGRSRHAPAPRCARSARMRRDVQGARRVVARALRSRAPSGGNARWTCGGVAPFSAGVREDPRVGGRDRPGAARRSSHSCRAVPRRVPASVGSARRLDTAATRSFPLHIARAASKARSTARLCRAAHRGLGVGWRSVADRTRVYDALARHARAFHSHSVRALRSPSAAAWRGKAGDGQLWSFGDTLRLTAGVYDAARGGAPLREVRRAWRRPARSGRRSTRSRFAAGRRSWRGTGVRRGADALAPCLRAYALGERAIREWDLGRAAREFRAAIRRDSASPRVPGTGAGSMDGGFHRRRDARSYRDL